MPRDETLDKIIGIALEEDVGPGDWTTQWTVGREDRGKAVVVAKEALVVAGTDPATRVFLRVEPSLEVTVLAPDGRRVDFEEPVLTVTGPLRGILTAERTAMNFLGHLSGIATLTRQYVDAVDGTGAQILDTRKTTPAWRILEKEAVLAGGGKNHRLGLHDMIMVKDNHLVAAGGIKAAVDLVRSRNEGALPLEVEVGTLEELEEAMILDLDRILLDNMGEETMAEAVRRVRRLGEARPLLEASGNVSLDNVRRVAETGVDLISVGALTHSAPAADLSLRVLRS